MFTFEEVWLKGIFGRLGEVYGLNILFWILGFILCAGISYLLGSLNFAILISQKKFHEDIRTFGSGNAGMTNMLRTYGKTAALATLLGDAAKTALSVLIVGRLLNGEWGAYVAGLACIVGHVYPLYFGFKGGKGVVTTAMMVLCLNPLVFAVLFLLFLIIVATTRYISLGSCICMLVYPFVLYRMAGPGFHVIIALLIAMFVLYLHRGNIQRLRNGTENKISFKKKDKKPVAVSAADVTDGKETPTLPADLNTTPEKAVPETADESVSEAKVSELNAPNKSPEKKGKARAEKR